MHKQDILQRAQADYNPSIVAINHELVAQVTIPHTELTLLSSGFDHAAEWHARPIEAIAFFIALNSINYRFWELEQADGQATLARYDFLGKVGSEGMTKAFHLMWGGAPYLSILRGKIGGKIGADFVLTHFGAIPDVTGRAANLNDIFESDKLERAAEELFARVSSNARFTVDDAHFLHSTFPQAYRDPYCKRSQLALAMIAGFLAETGIATDLSGLTGFADYQLPRIARAAEYLTYSRDLAHQVDHLIPIEADSAEERALRAATILLLEQLATNNGVTASHIDSYLFGLRKKAGNAPFHLTITDAY